MRVVNSLINGQDRAASDGKTFHRLNPVSGVLVTKAAAATVSDADAAVDAAAAAFTACSAHSPRERRMRLLKAAADLERRAAEFAAVGVEETGGTAGWFYFNVGLAADILREAAAMTTQITGETIPSNVRAVSLCLSESYAVWWSASPRGTRR